MKLADRLKGLLESFELTPLAFALSTGLKPNRVSAILQGAETTTREIHTMARFLRVSPEYLLTGDGAVGVQSRPGFRALVALLDTFPLASQDALLAVLLEATKRGIRMFQNDRD